MNDGSLFLSLHPKMAHLSFDDAKLINDELSALDIDCSLIDKFKQILSYYKSSKSDKQNLIQVRDDKNESRYLSMEGILNSLLHPSFVRFNQADEITITLYHFQGCIRSMPYNLYELAFGDYDYHKQGYSFIKPKNETRRDQYIQKGYIFDGTYCYIPYDSPVKFEIIDEFQYNGYVASIFESTFRFQIEQGRIKCDAQRWGVGFNFKEDVLNYKIGLDYLRECVAKLKEVSANNYKLFFEKYAIQSFIALVHSLPTVMEMCD